MTTFAQTLRRVISRADAPARAVEAPDTAGHPGTRALDPAPIEIAPNGASTSVSCAPVHVWNFSRIHAAWPIGESESANPIVWGLVPLIIA